MNYRCVGCVGVIQHYGKKSYKSCTSNPFDSFEKGELSKLEAIYRPVVRNILNVCMFYSLMPNKRLIKLLKVALCNFKIINTLIGF